MSVLVCVVVVSWWLLQDRSLLKNLALWLGRITLARNKPILHRDLNVKELPLEGYESGRLVAGVSSGDQVGYSACMLTFRLLGWGEGAFGG